MNSMMIGSANEAMMLLYCNGSPTSPERKNLNALFDVVSSIVTITAIDVAHDGTTSNIHIKVAKTKIAMMRCCTTVRLLIPKLSVGRFHTISVTASVMSARISFFSTCDSLPLFSLFALW